LFHWLQPADAAAAVLLETGAHRVAGGGWLAGCSIAMGWPKIGNSIMTLTFGKVRGKT
jgi:hypothetical protein